MLTTKEPIAIIGVGIRYPNSIDNLDSFWDTLMHKRSLITAIPQNRFQNIDDLVDVNRSEGKIVTKQGAWIDNVEHFDADFFNISPREAEKLDPHQRLILEVTFQAMEDAGVKMEDLWGSLTGVFAGMWVSDFEHVLENSNSEHDVYSTTGSGRYAASGRVSFFYNLQGPSITVDTACSTSLVATHLAVQSLQNHECNAAICTAANVLLDPYISICYSRSNLLSDYGRCRFGAEDAKGYVRCEGSAALILKRLSDAQKDGNHIYAIIPATACNNDGQSDKYMLAPSAVTQTALVRKALQNAGIDNREVQYIEAHGTGTNAGDPIELSSIPNALEPGRTPVQRYYVGSAKTIFGHTEAVAGFTGMIKCLLAMQHRIIPGNLYADMSKNPKVPWSELLLSIPQNSTSWPQPDKPLIAGVNAFGITGTNAHVLLQEAPKVNTTIEKYYLPFYILPISAASENALSQYLKSHIHNIKTLPSLDEVFNYVKNIACRKSDLRFRIAIIFNDKEELLSLLNLALVREVHENIAYGTAIERSGTTLVFPGQGSQWAGMGSQLYYTDPVFKESIDKCAQAFSNYVSWNLIDVLFDKNDKLSSIDLIQPAIIALEIAIAEWLMDRGILATSVVGHSMGEVASAYIAGIISLDDAANIICTRSALMKRTSGKGAMLYAAITAHDAQEYISGKQNQLSIGVINSPSAIVISGDIAAIDDLQLILENKNIFCRKVKVDVASHSPHMDELQSELLDAVKNIVHTKQQFRFYSTVEGRALESEEFTAQYWLKNLRNCVQFGKTIQQLIHDQSAHFIECSPHPVLVQAIQENIDFVSLDATVSPTMLREKPELHSLLMSLSLAFVQGVFVDWRKYYRNDYKRINMPTYPWQRERHWIEPASSAVFGFRKKSDGTFAHPLLHQFLQSGNEVFIWQSEITLKNLSYFGDHKVNELITFPAAAYMEIIIAAAQEAFASLNFSINNLQFKKAVLIPDSGLRIKISLVKNIGNQYDCIVSDWDNIQSIWTTATTANIEKDAFIRPDLKMISLDIAKSVCKNTISKSEHYAGTQSIGLPYKDTFYVVEEIAVAENICIGKILVSEKISNSLHKYQIHPTLLDGCLQVLLSEIYRHPHASTFVPINIGKFTITSHSESEELTCLCKVIAESHDAITANLIIYDNSEKIIAELQNVVFERLEKSASNVLENIYFNVEFEKFDIVNDKSFASDEVVFYGKSNLCREIALQSGGNRIDSISEIHSNTKAIVFVSEDAENDIPIISDLVKELVQLRNIQPRLYVISEHIYDATIYSKQPMLIGFHRVFCNEHPELKPTLISTSRNVKGLLQVIFSDTDENEIQIREDGYYAARLNRVELIPKNHSELSPNSTIYEAITEPGMLDNIHLSEKYLPLLGDEEVCIKVNSVGVNFMNLMSALGIYPGKHQGFATLGIELCGTVEKIGKSVTLHNIGDRVMGMGYHTMSSYVHTHEATVAKIPDTLSWHQASTLPVAYLTAYYSLVTLGKIEQGSRVLIHAATGGVGMAAVYIAKCAGAEIFATAGSELKRDYLKNVLGISYVYNSRDTDFYDKILQDTHGEGIDVVLNSLTGEQMWLSMQLLRDFGRFVEIGKKDIYENSKLGMEIFKKGLSYHMVDFEKILFEKPEWIYTLLQQIIPYFEKGHYKSLPDTRFEISNVQKAFETMATANVIGKVVVDIESKNADVFKFKNSIPIDANGIYVITGGYGGLGITYMQWLIARGANHIVLTGRNRPQSWAQQEIDKHISEGIDVQILQLDVSDSEKVSKTIRQLQSQRPLRGIIHLAGILDDAAIINFDNEKYRNTLTPKVYGADNLHKSTKDISLDFFVMMSSSALLFGSPGQSSYAAANAFLDGLAIHRHALGLPALSINLGTVSSVGLAASSGNRAERLIEEGIMTLNPEDCITILENALLGGLPVVGAFHFDVQKWQNTYKSAAQNPFLSRISTNKVDSTSEHRLSWKEQILAIPDKQEMLTAIEHTIKLNVGAVVKLSPEKIASKTNFKSLGIDSLMSIQLKNKLEAVCDTPISVTSFWTHSTIKDYAVFIAEKLGFTESPNTQQPKNDYIHSIEVQPSPIPAPEEIADEDISKLLADELRDLLAD